MDIEFKDSSTQAIAQLRKNKLKALTAIGLTLVEITTDYMEHKYGNPIRQTGDLIRSIAYTVDSNKNFVRIGSNLDYAPWVHGGTGKMPERPFLKDAIFESAEIIEEIASEHLGEGFEGGQAFLSTKSDQ